MYILTEDLTFYSEFREYAVVTVENQKANSFSQFNPSLHETEVFPILLEINQKEALGTSLNNQLNWVNRYIADKGILPQVVTI
jgi:hypothetical protein